MKGAFTKGVARSVTGNPGRFLAILGISALGCGFFAGLRMVGPDMRLAADAWYDRTGLCDLRVVGTQGLGEEDLERLSGIEGVESVSGSVSVDAMVRVGGEQVAARVQSIPEAYESGGEPDMDRLELVSGRWPSAPGECVASADNPALEVFAGDEVEVLAGTDALSTDRLEVVGTVSSSAYPYTVSFGSTSLSSGTLDQYLYVASGTFSEDAPPDRGADLRPGCARRAERGREVPRGRGRRQGRAGEKGAGALRRAARRRPRRRAGRG